MRTILLAEDDKKIAAALAIRLQEAGYEIIAVPNGSLGYKWSLTAQPDLLLLDIMMPRMSGLELAAGLRKAGLADVPIIFITAIQRPGLRETAAELGAAAFFEKPFEMNEMLAAIERVLSNAPRGPKPELRLALEQHHGHEADEPLESTV